MTGEIPDLLTGTDTCLVAEVPGVPGGGRWAQVSFNFDIARRFFSLEPGMDRSITLERISDQGRVEQRTSRRLVSSIVNRNARIEFSFGPVTDYPADGRALLVAVESSYLTYRYRTIVPGDSGHEEVLKLLSAGPSIGRGLRRRLVTLDELEQYWTHSGLRGGV